jgi:hypothetical protein
MRFLKHSAHFTIDAKLLQLILAAARHIAWEPQIQSYFLKIE